MGRRRNLPMLFTLAVAVFVPSAYGQHIAPTAALSPAEQQKKFHLPPGFEIQLVASEPEVL